MDTTTSARGVRGAVRRRPVLAFAVLVLVLSWPMMLLGGSAPWLFVLWVLGPASCAFLVTGLADGPAGVRELAGRVRRWRVPARWYLFVLFGMAAGYWAVAYTLTAVLSPADLAPPDSGQLTVLGLNFVILFFVNGLVEEFGWRGFALPRLEQWLTPLRATLAVGLLWWAWHLPLQLQLVTDPLVGLADRLLVFGLYLVLVLADAVVYTWVFHRTDGSVLLVAMLHAASNSWGALLYTSTFTADPPGFVAYFAVRVVVYLIVAVVIVLLTRGRCGYPGRQDA